MEGVPYDLTDRDRDLNLFNLEHDDDGRWLNTNYGDSDHAWNPEVRFVFRVPSPSASISP